MPIVFMRSSSAGSWHVAADLLSALLVKIGVIGHGHEPNHQHFFSKGSGSVKTQNIWHFAHQ